nr:NADH dehydrogenase subunit 1 [Ceratocombus sp. HL-2012]
MKIINYIFLLIMLLISVAFLTLLERKVLGYIQLRSGPNKVGVMGLLQPFSDGIKLFFKEQFYPFYSNHMIYMYSPIFLLFLSFFLWLVYPIYFINMSLNLGILFFLCCTSLGVYGIMISGWSSNSVYSMLGCLRSVAQTISYEVSMVLIMINMIIFIMSFDFFQFFIFQNYFMFIFFNIPLFFCWFSSCLAETNRAPFDFAEGESELVSGFNVEYSSGGFAFIFLSEYMNIIFMSMLCVLVFFGGWINSLMFFFYMLFLMFMFLWVRASLPRFRYDKLMYLTWKVFLPFSLNYLLFFSGIMMLLLMNM